MEHSDVILKILEERKVSFYKISKATKISDSLFSKWKTKPTSEISSKNLAKIADYLEVPVDYLLGRELPSIDTGQDLFTTEEIEHIKKYRQLDRRGQAAVDRTLNGELASNRETDLLSEA